MSLSAIEIDVFERLATSGETVVFPNIAEDPLQVEHVRVDILPANTETRGLNDLDVESGIVQVRVFSFQDHGVISAAQRAEAILNLFPRNTILNSCRFDKTGTINISYIDGSWFVTPVSITYNSIH